MHASLTQLVRHWTPKPVITSFYFAVVKYFNANIAISANFECKFYNLRIVLRQMLHNLNNFEVGKMTSSDHLQSHECRTHSTQGFCSVPGYETLL